MYAPALPSMQETFDVSIGYLNLTMFAFFFVSAFSTFLTGPLSDCCGRKPPLVLVTVLFAFSSAGCALSPSVEFLVVFRVLQGASVGGVQTLATALIQDAYAEDSVQTAMTFLQSLVIIGPVLAPFLGSFILMATSWRGVFAMLAFLGVVAVALALLVSETHEVRSSHNGAGAGVKESLRKVVRDCGALASTRSFLSLALIMGFAGVPFFCVHRCRPLYLNESFRHGLFWLQHDLCADLPSGLYCALHISCTIKAYARPAHTAYELCSDRCFGHCPACGWRDISGSVFPCICALCAFRGSHSTPGLC